MRYPPEQKAKNHERILEKAARLFRERGFDGIGVADLMKAAGLTHGGFYAHFSSKDALVAEACKRAMQEFSGYVSKAGAESDDPAATFLDRYLSSDHRDHPGFGCAMATLGGEIARQGPETRAAFTAELEASCDGIAAWFGGGESGRERCLQFLASLVGAMVLARAVNDEALSAAFLCAVKSQWSEIEARQGDLQ